MAAKKTYKPERNGTGPSRPSTKGTYRTHVLTNEDAQRIVLGADREDAEEIMMKLFRKRQVTIRLKFEDGKGYVMISISPTNFTYGKSHTLLVAMRNLAYALPAAAYMLDVLYPGFPDALEDDEEDALAI